MQIKRGGGGFTLAELLIVMAIIVVLAAVAIPTFGRQLETARETGDMELIRNAYNEALSMAILDGADGALNGKNGETDFETAAVHGVKITSETQKKEVDNPAHATDSTQPEKIEIDDPTGNITVEVTLSDTLKQTEKGWQYVRGNIMGVTVGGGEGDALTPQSGNTKATFKFIMGEDGAVKLDTSTAVVLT